MQLSYFVKTLLYMRITRVLFIDLRIYDLTRNATLENVLFLANFLLYRVDTHYEMRLNQLTPLTLTRGATYTELN